MTEFEQQVADALCAAWRRAPAHAEELLWLAPRVAAAIRAGRIGWDNDKERPLLSPEQDAAALAALRDGPTERTGA